LKPAKIVATGEPKDESPSPLSWRRDFESMAHILGDVRQYLDQAIRMRQEIVAEKLLLRAGLSQEQALEILDESIAHIDRIISRYGPENNA
jgi:hypothetical protein